MSLTHQIALAAFSVLVIGFILANGYYKGKHHTGCGLIRTATIISGKDAGRTGKLVSYWPFDILVSINTAATPEETKKMIEQGRICKEYADYARSWPSCWRWQCEIKEESEIK